MKINEVAAILGITSSAVKKYYLLFEKNNYKFTRSKQGQLVFSEYEIELFRKLIHLKNEPGNTVEKSIEILLNKVPQKNKELDLKQLMIQQGLQLNNILDIFKEMDNKIKKLNKKVDKLEGLIEKKFEKVR
ncbi:MerR family transcriptional regulator [Metabacillus idriensis]|uniref:MerR family transcriptional regulator n=1 Tax=Metabacillus idriensis TaxID=324768 RepID=UPI00174C6190|nr:MerR family transcriptional regulator [Metabacillus idriensis]